MDTVRTIGFLGSGEIAVPVLKALCGCDGLRVGLVNTQPDRPAGRKKQLTPTPIGAFAEAEGLPLTKLDVNSDAFLTELERVRPEMLVVIDFGQLLKQRVLDAPPFGCVNIHASLLPKYRGASPIQSAILEQEHETGITFIQMERGLDTGPVFRKVSLPLDPGTRADDLLRQLGELAAEYVGATVLDILNGGCRAEPQDHAQATLCRKIARSDGEADWLLPAARLAAMSRAYHPWPGLWFTMDRAGKPCRIRVTETQLRALQGTPSEILDAGKDRWVIACGQDALEIMRLVPEGKSEMTAAEFLRGHPLHPGTLLAETRNHVPHGTTAKTSEQKSETLQQKPQSSPTE